MLIQMSSPSPSEVLLSQDIQVLKLVHQAPHICTQPCFGHYRLPFWLLGIKDPKAELTLDVLGCSLDRPPWCTFVYPK